MDFTIPDELIELKERTERFVRDDIMPREGDPRLTAHGPSEEFRRAFHGCRFDCLPHVLNMRMRLLRFRRERQVKHPFNLCRDVVRNYSGGGGKSLLVSIQHDSSALLSFLLCEILNSHISCGRISHAPARGIAKK